MPELKLQYEYSDGSLGYAYKIRIGCTSLYEHYNNFKKFNLNNYVCAMQQIYPSTQRIWDYDEAQSFGLKFSKYNWLFLTEQYRLVNHVGVLEIKNGQYRYVNSPSGKKIYLQGNYYNVTTAKPYTISWYETTTNSEGQKEREYHSRTETWGDIPLHDYYFVEGFSLGDDPSSTYVNTYGNVYIYEKDGVKTTYLNRNPASGSIFGQYYDPGTLVWEGKYSQNNARWTEIPVFDSAMITVGSGTSGWANIPFHDAKNNLAHPIAPALVGGSSSSFTVYGVTNITKSDIANDYDIYTSRSGPLGENTSDNTRENNHWCKYYYSYSHHGGTKLGCSLSFWETGYYDDELRCAVYGNEGSDSGREWARARKSGYKYWRYLTYDRKYGTISRNGSITIPLY